LLWLAAFVVVLPAWGYGIATGRLLLALGGLPLAVLMIYCGFAKRVCPACGKTVRTVSDSVSNCVFCGAPYDQADA
jgi:hypothetical protein